MNNRVWAVEEAWGGWESPFGSKSQVCAM